MYADIDQAKEYLKKRYSKLPDDTSLKLALQRAFDNMEMVQVRDPGEIQNFPRLGEEKVPQKIINAQIEEAYAISFIKPKSEVKSASNSNIKSKSDGDMSVTYVIGTLSGVQFTSRYAYDVMKRYKRKTYG